MHEIHKQSFLSQKPTYFPDFETATYVWKHSQQINFYFKVFDITQRIFFTFIAALYDILVRYPINLTWGNLQLYLYNKEPTETDDTITPDSLEPIEEEAKVSFLRKHWKPISITCLTAISVIGAYYKITNSLTYKFVTGKVVCYTRDTGEFS
jgi:hypothetical protein